MDRLVFFIRAVMIRLGVEAERKVRYLRDRIAWIGWAYPAFRMSAREAVCLGVDEMESWLDDVMLRIRSIQDAGAFVYGRDDDTVSDDLGPDADTLPPYGEEVTRELAGI